MDKMTSAETNDKAVLEQLVATTTTQYTEIKDLLQELKYQRGSNNSGRNPNTNNTNTNHKLDGNYMRKLKKRNATLKHNIMKGCSKGGFCSSHGHSVIAGHDSRDCPDRKPGQLETATREKSAGPEKYSNKGWDDFWN